MKFDAIKFEEEDESLFEAAIPRPAFKDCSKRVVLTNDGYLEEYSASEAKPEKTITLTAWSDVHGKIADCQRAAYDHFLAHVAEYEARALQYLGAKAQENLREALAADDADPDLPAVVKKHGLAQAGGVKRQISFSGLTLFDHGWEGIGFVTLDFDCGWDVEHGSTLLMHRGRLIAESGLADFTNRGDSLLGHAKCCQEMTPGFDVPLP